MSHAAEIIAHYRAKGLKGFALSQALARHQRLLEPLDPNVAQGIEREAEKIERVAARWGR